MTEDERLIRELSDGMGLAREREIFSYGIEELVKPERGCLNICPPSVSREDRYGLVADVMGPSFFASQGPHAKRREILSILAREHVLRERDIKILTPNAVAEDLISVINNAQLVPEGFKGRYWLEFNWRLDCTDRAVIFLDGGLVGLSEQDLGKLYVTPNWGDGAMSVYGSDKEIYEGVGHDSGMIVEAYAQNLSEGFQLPLRNLTH